MKKNRLFQIFDIFMHSLTLIFENMQRTDQVPEDWKMLNIFSGFQKKQLKNYRRATIISVFQKNTGTDNKLYLHVWRKNVEKKSPTWIFFTPIISKQFHFLLKQVNKTYRGRKYICHIITQLRFSSFCCMMFHKSGWEAWKSKWKFHKKH